MAEVLPLSLGVLQPFFIEGLDHLLAMAAAGMSTALFALKDWKESESDEEGYSDSATGRI